MNHDDCPCCRVNYFDTRNNQSEDSKAAEEDTNPSSFAAVSVEDER